MHRVLNRIILALTVILAWPVAATAQPAAPIWTSANLTTLQRWVEAAPQDALPKLDMAKVDAIKASGDQAELNRAATELALKLARMHLLGSSGTSARTGWNIADSDRDTALEPILAQALEAGTLDTFFALLRPNHSEYSSLRAAYSDADLDEVERAAIARSMERWRWMPRSLGSDYVLVNTANFEARLWREGEHVGTWPVIVGKTSTPTPVFRAEIEGVIFNPWWNIPQSIVHESVGALVRRNPSLARARGYVWSGGNYRQRPGPNNALGQMKLVMPNPYSVYMHDTPGKEKFAEEVRTFSHGCIRTGDAIGYAATLLEGIKSREEIDAIVASNKTTRVDLAAPIPVYVTYFTAVSDGEGGVDILPDVYGRDQRITMAKLETECSLSG
ncbi:L,D-transpeptidase family protein [Altererythrobacter sp. GH1-8]|uniref:L,D-transpeptidase family protein n=1 Tax=Altererythrobacter sp. GH1-8 TaxID=3349333 RepID=UPI00374CCE3A